MLDMVSKAPYFRVDGPVEKNYLAQEKSVQRIGQGRYCVETPDGEVISDEKLSWKNVVWLVDTMSELVIQRKIFL